MADLLEETNRRVEGYQTECREVEQVLGAVLGYPWFKDDQTNFPDATEVDGVCVGEHVAGTIAAEAAAEITRLNQALHYEQDRSGRVGTHGPGCEHWGPRHYECLLAKYVELKGVG